MRVVTVAPGERRSEAVWIAALAFVTALAALAPLVFAPRFYFADDTQAGAWPIWVTLGESLRAGQLPFFEPGHWMAGNLAAEGQWGLLNPLMWLMGLFAAQVAHGALASAVVKVAFLVLGAVGVFVLARSFGAQRLWAGAAGLAAAGGGFTVYVDAASWVTSLIVWALLPLAWWGLRLVSAGRSPLWAFVPGYLLVTTGYVHGTLMLIGAIVGVLLETALHRQWPLAWRTLCVSVLLGLVALAVFLPGVLASPVTVRQGEGVANSNFMSATLSDLAASAAPTGQPWISGFWPLAAPAPLAYISFLLPLFALVSFARLRPHLRTLASVVSVGVLSALLVLGPSDLGPLRFPMRAYPDLALVIVLLLALGLSLARAEITRSRLIAVGLLLAGSAWFAYAEAPEAVMSLLAGSVAAAAALGALARALVRHRDARVVAAVVAGGTLAVTAVQHAVFPVSPLPDFALPSDRAAYLEVVPEAAGDVTVVGAAPRTPEGWATSSYANGWLLTEPVVANVYSPIMHRGYAEDLCVDSHGVMCWEALETLLEVDPATGRPLVDLLGISSLQIIARPVEDLVPGGGTAQDPYTFAEVPEGWHEVARDDIAALWVRDEVVPGAGGVTAASPGLEVAGVAANPSQVRVQLGAVPPDGGQLVFSRLDWPGYSVSGGELAPSVRGYLVAVDVAPDAAGGEVVLTFTPAGWRVGLVALAISLATIVAWVVAERVRSRLRRARP